MPEIKQVYQQIREYIEKEARKSRPGESLNSEVQYCALFKVSRPTVRKAVDELIKEGLVKRLPGKGLFAADGQKDLDKAPLLFLIPYFPEDGFFYNMVMGCVDASNKAGFGYKIINSVSPEERLDQLREVRLSSYSAAILTAYENEYDKAAINTLRENNLPFVLVDNLKKDVDCPYVITDDFKGGYLSAEYLVKKGHRDILYITLDTGNNTVERRETGFKKALQDYGINIPSRNFLHIKNDEDIKELLPGIKTEYTAICSYSDLPVIIALSLLQGTGIRVPQEVSLMGYGNFKYGELLHTPLTTISMPVYDMGYKAAEMAVDMAVNHSLGSKVTLDVEIIERASVTEARVR